MSRARGPQKAAGSRAACALSAGYELGCEAAATAGGAARGSRGRPERRAHPTQRPRGLPREPSQAAQQPPDAAAQAARRHLARLPEFSALPEWVPHARGAPWSLRGPAPAPPFGHHPFLQGPFPEPARVPPLLLLPGRGGGTLRKRGAAWGRGAEGRGAEPRLPGPGPGAVLPRVCSSPRTFLASACFGFSLRALLQAPTASSSCQRHVRPRARGPSGMGRRREGAGTNVKRAGAPKRTVGSQDDRSVSSASQRLK